MATENTVLGIIRASRPTFRNAHDKVVFVVHAIFLNSGYELVATGNAAFAEDILFSPPTSEVGIDGWNDPENNYGFVYKKNGGGNVYVLVTCLVVGDKLIIDAASNKDQDKEPISLEINVPEYDGGNETTSYAIQYKDLPKLVKTLDLSIVKKIENVPATTTKNIASSSLEANLREDISREPQHEQQIPPGGMYIPYQPDSFDDIHPGPGAGVYPRGYPDSGGMLVGPNDPRWFQPEQPGFPNPLGVPPGARFDQYGPPGVPGFEPNRFGRGPGSRRPGTDPDLHPFGNPDFI